MTGTFRYAHTWPAAIALAASGRVQLDRLVTGHYGLDQVARGPDRRAHRRARRSSPSSGRRHEPDADARLDEHLLARARRLMAGGRAVLGICGAPGRRQVHARRAAGRRPSDRAPWSCRWTASTCTTTSSPGSGSATARVRPRPSTWRGTSRCCAAARRDRPRRLRPRVRPVPRGVGRRRDRRTPGAPAGGHRGQLPAATTARAGPTCCRCSTRRGSSRATRRRRLERLVAPARRARQAARPGPALGDRLRPGQRRPRRADPGRRRRARRHRLTHRQTRSAR